MRGEILNYLRDNPLQAECAEDLLNWACDEFEIDDDHVADEIWAWIRRNTNLPK